MDTLDGIDVVVRIGGVDDSNLIAHQIKTLPLIFCASPEYLEKKGRPKVPQDACHHLCILDSNFRIGKHWPIISPDGVRESATVNSRIVVNRLRAIRKIALAHGGIGMIHRFIVDDGLADRSLQEALPGYSTLEFGLFALYPHRRYLSKKVRYFIDFLIAHYL